MSKVGLLRVSYTMQSDYTMAVFTLERLRIYSCSGLGDSWRVGRSKMLVSDANRGFDGSNSNYKEDELANRVNELVNSVDELASKI